MIISSARRPAFALAVLALAACLLTACSSYKLRGKVVRGEYSAIELVPADDPRLDQPGLPGVNLHLQTDPNRLNRETVARVTSGIGGEFEIPVDLPGAGFLIYDMGLYARRDNYSPAQSLFRLPSGNRRVLITMTAGQDRDLGESGADPLRDYEDFR